MQLTWLDYAVIAGYLAAITSFGVWFQRFQRTTRDYFLSGRNVPWWAVCCTVVATETSTLTFIGIPAASYAGNMTFLQLAAGYVIGRLIVSVVFLPAYFRGDLVTSYQWLEQRLGGRVQALSAIVFLVTRSLADGIRLFATALVVSVVTTLPVTGVVVALAAVMILYTVRGGAGAVIWTDVIQMFVYAAGAAIVAAVLWQSIDGGWSAVITLAGEQGKFVWLDTSFDPTRPYTLWAGLLGGLALTLSTHGTDHFLVQRLLSARSARDAQLGLTLSGFVVFAQFTLFLLIGVLLFVHYQQTPLPRPLTRVDEVLPLFVLTSVGPGLAGLVVAAIVAAALSPSLNAMAATTVNDLYLRYVRPDADEATRLRVSRRATVVWGVVQLAVALAAQWMNRSVLDAGLTVLSLAAGSVLGAFLIAAFARRIDERDALAGMLCGLVAMGAVWALTAVAFTWFVLIGATTTCVVAALCARLMPLAARPAVPR